MATVLTPVEPATTEALLRMVPVAADLMPREILDARRARQARRIVLSTIAAFAVLLMGWYAVAAYETSTVRTELAEVTSRSQEVQRQQQQYSDVTSVQNQSRAINSQLGALLAQDLQWSDLMAALRATASRNSIEIVTINGQLAGDTVAAEGGPATAQRAVGTVTVTGSGDSKAEVAAYVRALADVPGTANPQLGTVLQQGDKVDFTVKLDITEAALGGRFTPAKPNK